MARKKAFDIDPRELFIMLESLVVSMDVIRGSRGGYSQMPPDRHPQLEEAHALFLKLEEVWDRMPERDREEGAAEPFNVRDMLAVANPGAKEQLYPGDIVIVKDGRDRWGGTVVQMDDPGRTFGSTGYLFSAYPSRPNPGSCHARERGASAPWRRARCRTPWPTNSSRSRPSARRPAGAAIAR